MKTINLLIGKPGSGKTTVGSWLENEMNSKYLSLGSFCRSEINSKTNLGKEIEAYFKDSKKFPPSFLQKIVTQMIHDNPNVIIDGMPRRLEEISILKNISTNSKKGVCILINIPDDVATSRVHGRIGRHDNNELAYRLDEFSTNIDAILLEIKKLGFKVVSIDGSPPVSTVKKSISKSLNSEKCNIS